MFAQLLRKFDPNQPRGKTVEGTNDGSFAPSGHHVQGGSGSPEKWKTYDLFKRISEKDGGFTYQPVTGQEAKTGFALSTYPQRSFAKDAKDFKLTDLISYVAKNRDLFERKNHFLGGWHDPETGKIFLDVSVMTEDRKKAERLALKYDQIAYFDLGAGKSVTVNRAATSGGAAKEEHDEPEATDAARAAWIESYLAGGTGEDVHSDVGARADGGGNRGSESDAGEEGLGFSYVFKAGTSDGARKAWEVRHAAGDTAHSYRDYKIQEGSYGLFRHQHAELGGPVRAARSLAEAKKQIDFLYEVGKDKPKKKSEDFAHLFKYDPKQPRAPRGDPDGGKWVSEASVAGNPATSLMANAKTFTKEEAAAEGEKILAATLTPAEAEQYKKHLDEINRALAAGESSKALNTIPGTDRYTAERLKLHNEILDDLMHRAQSFATPARGDKPTVIVLGGRGGSGKSSFGTYVKNGAAIGVYNENHFLKLDTDEFKTLLAQHDKKSMTDSLGQPSVGWRAALYHDESADMFDKAVVLARHANLNVVLDVTLNSPHSERVALFKKAGYNVEGHYMHLPPRLAAERAVGRARDGGTMNGRLVPPSYVLTSTRNEKSFEALMPKFDKWSVYSNDVPRGQTPKLVAKGEKKRGEEGYAHLVKAGTSEGAIKAWETIHAKYPEKFGEKQAKANIHPDNGILQGAQVKGQIGNYTIHSANEDGGKKLWSTVYPTMDAAKAAITQAQLAHSAYYTHAQVTGTAAPMVTAPVVEATPKQLDLIPGGKQIDYPKVTRGDALYDTLNRDAREFWKTLPNAVVNSIMRYTGNGYKAINHALARDQLDTVAVETHRHIEKLDSLMHNATIPIDMRVHRVMAVNNLVDSFPDLKGMRFMGNEKHNEALMKSMVGRTYKEKVFASTSLKDSYHMAYSEAADKHGRIGLQINVPKGSSGYFVGDRGSHPGEEELLLPRNSQFLITGYHKHILHVDLLPGAH